ncbi:MAG TPA: hypothetical protein VIT92_14745, partial [Burkholderiaceae bacterium]
TIAVQLPGAPADTRLNLSQMNEGIQLYEYGNAGDNLVEVLNLFALGKTDYRKIDAVTGSNFSDAFYINGNGLRVLDGGSGDDRAVFGTALAETMLARSASGQLRINGIAVSNVDSFRFKDDGREFSTQKLLDLLGSTKADSAVSMAQLLGQGGASGLPPSASSFPDAVKTVSGAGRLDYAAVKENVVFTQQAAVTGGSGATVTGESLQNHSTRQYDGITEIAGTGLRDIFIVPGAGLARIDGGAGSDLVHLWTEMRNVRVSANADGSLKLNDTVFANIETFMVGPDANSFTAAQITTMLQTTKLIGVPTLYDLAIEAGR